MNPLATLFKRSAAPLLLGTMGETVTYYAEGGVSGRSITALVERGIFEVPQETGEQVTASLSIRVYNDSTTGISATEIDTGLDEIGAALRDGAAESRRRIVRVISDANGMLRLLVQ